MKRGSEFISGTDAATPPKVRAGNGEHVSQQEPAFPHYRGFEASGVSAVMTGPPRAQGQVVVGFQQNHPAAGLQPAPQTPSTYVNQLVHENVAHRQPSQQMRGYGAYSTSGVAIARRLQQAGIVMPCPQMHRQYWPVYVAPHLMTMATLNGRSPINNNLRPTAPQQGGNWVYFPPPRQPQ